VAASDASDPGLSDVSGPAGGGEAPEVGAPAPRSGRLGLVLGIAAAVVVVDQLSKTWAVHRLSEGDIDVIGSLRFNLVFNSGASFSLGSGLGPFISLMVVAVAVGLFWAGRTTSSKLASVAIGFLLGGALGNLLDRAFRSGDGFLGGHVVDFIDLQWWPVWNVADAAVTIGGVLLVIHLLFGDSGGSADAGASSPSPAPGRPGPG
jgi:signal peptidase II